MFLNSSSNLLGCLVLSKLSFPRLSPSLLLCCSLFSILGGALSLLSLSSSFFLVSSSTIATRTQIYSSIWFEELRTIEKTKNFRSGLDHRFQYVLPINSVKLMMPKIVSMLFIQQSQRLLCVPAKQKRDFGRENTSGVFPLNPSMIKSE